MQVLDAALSGELEAGERLLSHVVLCGGTAGLPGLAARLRHELQQLGTQRGLPTTGWTVHPATRGDGATFEGARVVAGCSSFGAGWCSPAHHSACDGAKRAVDAPTPAGEEDGGVSSRRLSEAQTVLGAAALALAVIAAKFLVHAGLSFARAEP